jgi:hypothetical protein
VTPAHCRAIAVAGAASRTQVDKLKRLALRRTDLASHDRRAGLIGAGNGTTKRRAAPSRMGVPFEMGRFESVVRSARGRTAARQTVRSVHVRVERIADYL